MQDVNDPGPLALYDFNRKNTFFDQQKQLFGGYISHLWNPGTS